MRKSFLVLIMVALGVLVAGASLWQSGRVKADDRANANETTNLPPDAPETAPDGQVATYQGFEVEVLVNGTPLTEYAARGRRYVEALEGAEYELRIKNPLGVRVAVSLSVDGLNTIDARRTTAWAASKWVIQPYQTITIGGWQMSSARARRFFFTTERDSYGAKLGQTANLGVISAVFFRERQAQPVTIVPYPRRRSREDSGTSKDQRAPDSPAGSGQTEDSVRTESSPNAGSSAKAGTSAKPRAVSPTPDDESAATGIGRSVNNDVHWVNLDLLPSPVAETTVRYEYRAALVRLGILPRPYPTEPLRRREQSTGFTDGSYCPEP
jgi:hypothetical protein